MNIDFESYIRGSEPDKKEKASAWKTAIGLQAVDGLQTSDYLKDTAVKHIENKQSFAFSVAGFTSIHRRLFEGIFKFAGKIRDYDITKKGLAILNPTK